MTDDNADFREFAAAFGEPLMRVAYLLVAGVAPDGVVGHDEERAGERVVRALARVRRNWRQAVSVGAPESVAIESLVARLPREAARPAPPTERETVEEEDDDELLLDAVWRAWKAIPPVERVPLLFADVGVASRQLEGIAVPDSFGSGRRLRSLAATAWERLRACVVADPDAATLLAGQSTARLDVSVDALLGRSLAREAAKVSAPVESYPRALAVAGRTRRRIGVAAAAAVAVIVAGTVGGVSTSRHGSDSTAADPTPVDTATASSASAAPSSEFVASDDERVVDWPIRGELSDDTALLSNLRSSFVANTLTRSATCRFCSPPTRRRSGSPM